MPDRGAKDAANSLDALVAAQRRARAERDREYRARALQLFPWVCAHCGRTFDAANLRQLTVHHRDHNHEHNPPDGSNWELLCIYCHDNAHQRDQAAAALADGPVPTRAPRTTHQPFAGLLERDDDTNDGG